VPAAAPPPSTWPTRPSSSRRWPPPLLRQQAPPPSQWWRRWWQLLRPCWTRTLQPTRWAGRQDSPPPPLPPKLPALPPHPPPLPALAANPCPPYPLHPPRPFHPAATPQAIGACGAKALMEAVAACKQRPARAGGRVRVLTHCNTGSLATAAYGTALGVMRALHEQEKLEQAYCTETRPYNQGGYPVGGGSCRAAAALQPGWVPGWGGGAAAGQMQLYNQGGYPVGGGAAAGQLQPNAGLGSSRGSRAAGQQTNAGLQQAWQAAGRGGGKEAGAAHWGAVAALKSSTQQAGAWEQAGMCLPAWPLTAARGQPRRCAPDGLRAGARRPTRHAHLRQLSGSPHGGWAGGTPPPPGPGPPLLPHASQPCHPFTRLFSCADCMRYPSHLPCAARPA